MRNSALGWVNSEFSAILPILPLTSFRSPQGECVAHHIHGNLLTTTVERPELGEHCVFYFIRRNLIRRLGLQCRPCESRARKGGHPVAIRQPHLGRKLAHPKCPISRADNPPHNYRK
jgi:hypothetical protein